MDTQAKTIVRVERHYSAPMEQVFDAWLDPKNAGHWLFATPTVQMVKVEIDAQVSGKFIFVDQRDGEDIIHTGEYLEINRPHHLVFTFLVEKYSNESTRVIIDIVPMKAGCKLTLAHEGVFLEYACRTEAGWTSTLNGLALALG